MILTDTEMNSIRDSIEAKAGWDKDLSSQCSHLVHIGHFDAAVHSAFVLLEQRLGNAANRDGLTGSPLAGYAFGGNGPLALLATQAGYNDAEREGLRELYSGAFKVFRNPTAHRVVGYNSVECRTIIGLVNLLLGVLDNLTGQKSIVIPQNVESAIAETQGTLGQNASNRLRAFLAECIKSGINPQASAKSWLPFKRIARVISTGRWPKSKLHSITMFYLRGKKSELRFPLNHYKKVKDFNISALQKELKGLGFQITGPRQNIYRVDLHIHNDQVFFDNLFALVLQTTKQIDLS